MPAKPRKDRRAPDPRIGELQEKQQHLHGCVHEMKQDVAALKAAVAENTQITQQVADILATFKVTLAIGKWIAAAGAAVASVGAAVKGWRS